MLQGYHGFVRPKHLIDSEEKRERREWFDSVMKKKDEESKTTQESKGGHAQRLGQKWKKAKTKAIIGKRIYESLSSELTIVRFFPPLPPTPSTSSEAVTDNPLIIAFPDLGNTAYSYRLWGQECQNRGVDLVAVQYPGRHSRCHERPLSSIQELAKVACDGIYQSSTISSLSDTAPTILFGTGMGALVAFETMKLIFKNRPLMQYKETEEEEEERFRKEREAAYEIEDESKRPDPTTGIYRDLLEGTVENNLYLCVVGSVSPQYQVMINYFHEQEIEVQREYEELQKMKNKKVAKHQMKDENEEAESYFKLFPLRPEMAMGFVREEDKRSELEKHWMDNNDFWKLNFPEMTCDQVSKSPSIHFLREECLRRRVVSEEIGSQYEMFNLVKNTIQADFEALENYSYIRGERGDEYPHFPILVVNPLFLSHSSISPIPTSSQPTNPSHHESKQLEEEEQEKGGFPMISNAPAPHPLPFSSLLEMWRRETKGEFMMVEVDGRSATGYELMEENGLKESFGRDGSSWNELIFAKFGSRSILPKLLDGIKLIGGRRELIMSKRRRRLELKQYIQLKQREQDEKERLEEEQELMRRLKEKEDEKKEKKRKGMIIESK